MVKTLIPIIAKYAEYPVENMSESTSFVTDIEINSLDYVKAIMEIEDEFDIEIPEEEIGNLYTIGDLAKLVSILCEEE